MHNINTVMAFFKMSSLREAVMITLELHVFHTFIIFNLHANLHFLYYFLLYSAFSSIVNIIFFHKALSLQ